MHHALLSNGPFRLYRVFPFSLPLICFPMHPTWWICGSISTPITSVQSLPAFLSLSGFLGGSHSGMVGVLTRSGNACNQTLTYPIILLIRIVIFVPNQLRKQEFRLLQWSDQLQFKGYLSSRSRYVNGCLLFVVFKLWLVPKVKAGGQGLSVEGLRQPFPAPSTQARWSRLTGYGKINLLGLVASRACPPARVSRAHSS